VVLASIAQFLFQEQFSAFVELFQEAFAGGRTDSAEWQVLESLKPIVGYLILSSQVFESLLALLLARYWQAGLYNPGGLKAEMHVMRFSLLEAAFLVVAVALSFVIQPAAIMLFGIPFIFAGMALMHGVVAKLKLGGQWLVALYIALVLFNQILVPLLVMLVLVDVFVNIRARIPERAEPDNE
jgi:hypothetical protein